MSVDRSVMIYLVLIGWTILVATATKDTTESCKVHVGNSSTKIISSTVSEGCVVCPAVINKSNWLGGHSYADEFAVTQNGLSLKVERTDANHGWGMDLTFMCYHAGFSISGGPSANEGNVFYNGKPICDDSWDDNDALVFCKMFFYQDGTATHYSKYGHVSSDFSMDEVGCTGNEVSLLDCDYQTHENCGRMEGAGVICSTDFNGAGTGAVLLYTDADYQYYKVAVPTSSKMSSAVVLSTCEKFSLKPQCYHANQADDNCVQAPSTSIHVTHPRAMSMLLCDGNTDPRECASTVNMFWYMKNWSGSACGVIKGRGFGGICSDTDSAGEGYTSTSDRQYFAACVKAV